MKSFRSLIRESLDVPTPSVESIAKKHGVSVASIEAQVAKGITVEKEHTTDDTTAREIALDHLGEIPDYYDHLGQMEKSAVKESYVEESRSTPSADHEKHAKLLGLTHYGNGEYGREGLITHTAPKDATWGGLVRLTTPRKTKGHETSLREEKKNTKTPHEVLADYEYHPTYRSARGQVYRHANGLHSLILQHDGTWQHYHTHSQAGHVKLGSGIAGELAGHLSKEHRVDHSVKTIKEGYDMTFNESEETGYKVNDKVIPKIGPHKGQVHTVIHVHPTGHLNIRPDNVHHSRNRYHLGAAKADPKDVSRHLGEQFTPMPRRSGEQMRDIVSARRTSRVVSDYHKKHKAAVLATNALRHKYPKLFPDDIPANAPSTKLKEGDQHDLSESPIKVFLKKQTAKDVKYDAPWQVQPQGKTLDRPSLGSVLSRKTIHEAFQAGKDRLKAGDFGAPKDVASSGDPDPAKSPGDAPAPGDKKKGGNAPPPQRNSKKVEVKGPGVDDRFQPEPIVTPMTTLPNQTPGMKS